MSSAVLIVDDDLDILEFLSFFVEDRFAMPTLGQTDGSGVLNRARSEQPALILLDINLPGRNGWDVLGDLKADESTRTIPVIVMTAGADTANERKALSLGAVAFVDKPFDLPELETLLEAHLSVSDRCESIGAR